MHLDDSVPISHLVSALTGGGMAGFALRVFVGRALRDLDRVTTKLESVSNKLILLESKYDKVDKLENVLHEHDIKIIQLETRQRNGARSPQTSL